MSIIESSALRPPSTQVCPMKSECVLLNFPSLYGKKLFPKICKQQTNRLMEKKKLV